MSAGVGAARGAAAQRPSGMNAEAGEAKRQEHGPARARGPSAV